MENIWKDWNVSNEVKDILANAKKVKFPKDRKEIFAMAVDGDKDTYEISYNVEGKGKVVEALVSKCKNGLVINYPDKYLRRRDPHCLVIGDNQETDKPRFDKLYNRSFDEVRKQTFNWLKEQELAVIAIRIGGEKTGYQGLLIAPINAGFFIGALADLQGIIDPAEISKDFNPRAIIYLAPPFRHTLFNGKQVVVHNRMGQLHEIFSYNLYPGPSAKKGIYGVLLHIGEKENWLTLHGSTVQVITPYDNTTTFLHEGASGSGKSEMLEYPHRQHDGRLLFGKNQITKENFFIGLNQSCSLRPVTDDMAISFNNYSGFENKLVVYDAEEAWFIRLNHIDRYGTDPYLEDMCIHPQEPLIFLNIEGVPNSTSLIWEHTQDAPGKPCPNPRVIIPRRFLKDIVNNPVDVDLRSFGIRVPVCTKENPSYGIMGILHILPASLAWLWRLVAPRGHDNPSITESSGLSSEGVGSYWPFATGKFINHANLLLEQIETTTQTKYVLLPNQHIGAWEVGFMPQWIAREFLARKGVAKFKKEQLLDARCPLLGYIPLSMRIEGTPIPEIFFQVEKQPEVGIEAYEKGSQLLYDFFHEELEKYLKPELSKLGKEIITCCLDKGSLEDYSKLIPVNL